MNASTDRLLGPVLRLGPGPRTYLLAAALGVPVGAVAGVYLWLVRVLRHLVWDGEHPRLAEVMPLAVAVLVTTTVGGLVVGLVRARHDSDSPHDLDDVLLDVDLAIAASRGEDGEPDEGESAHPTPPRRVSWILRAAVLGVVSLTAGASLGPEAPLIALALGFGERIARVLRLSRSEAVVISAAGALSGLFGGPLGAAVLPVEDDASQGRSFRLLGPGLLAGLTGFATMLAVLPDGTGLRYEVPELSGGRLSGLAWAVPGALLAAVVTAGLLLSIAPARALAERVSSTVVRATAGGLLLGLCALVQPLVLFSGEHEGQELLDRIGTWTVGTLVVLVVLKILATVVSLATGYFGGQIFPGAFVGMASALVLTALVPGAPAVAILAAGAGAGTTVLLRRPLASTLVMLFFFPLDLALPILVGAGVGAWVVSLLRHRLPEAPGMGAH